MTTSHWTSPENLVPLSPVIQPAIDYLHSIERKFNDVPKVHEQFIEIIEILASQRVNIIDVVERLSAISKDEPLLVYGLTPFLPPNYKISLLPSGEFTITPSITGINYGEICTLSSVQYLHGRVQRHGEFPVEGGAFADIWEGTFENRKVAIKILRRFGVDTSKYATRLWRECRTWGELAHPNILPFLGVCLEHISETTLVPCFVSPWMDNGTVVKFIHSHPHINRLPLLLGIAEGLRYLHTRFPAVVHGDIRAGNILVSTFGTPFLSDFGLSRMLLEGGGMTSTSFAGSSRWMAPELFDSEHPVTTHSDVWAFGMTIIEILTGKPPYQEVTNHTFVYQHIVKRKLPIRPTNVEGLDEHMWRLFLNCCVHKPSKRLAISAIADRLMELSSPSPVQSTTGRGRSFSFTRSRSSTTSSISQTQDHVIGPSHRHGSLLTWSPPEIWPPNDEIQPDEEAKRISDLIDEQLRQEATLRMKTVGQKHKEIRVILLGQSGSGKSTALKQFQLACTTHPFNEERHAWRLVIYSNIIRSVRRIFDVLQFARATADNPTSSNPIPADDVGVGLFLNDMYLRLNPLWGLEEPLHRRLGGKAHRAATRLDLPDPITMTTSSMERPLLKRLGAELAFRTVSQIPSYEECSDYIAHSARVLDSCRDSLAGLWTDERVQAKLQQRCRLQEEGGFFLDCLHRVTALDYVPSDADILQARLRAVGAHEHSFESGIGHGGTQTWRFYETHGAKWNRYVWLGHFDGLDAIIFVAPISDFDQFSPDEPSINSIEDSVKFWSSIIGNKLLGDIPIILLLNKCDLLQVKLEAGISFRRYVTSFGDRDNEHHAVIKYLREKILKIHDLHSCNPKRKVYAYPTTLTDVGSIGPVMREVLSDIILLNIVAEVSLV